MDNSGYKTNNEELGISAEILENLTLTVAQQKKESKDAIGDIALNYSIPLGANASIVDSKADDFLYSATFTGVHGNYLRPSVEAAGLNPEEHMDGSKDSMNFGSSATKAWKDIWGSGQGIGNINVVKTVSDAVDDLEEEYNSAKLRLEEVG